MFEEVHPTKKSRSVADEHTGSKRVRVAEHNDFVRCIKCGWRLDTHEHIKSEYDGISYSTTDWIKVGRYWSGWAWGTGNWGADQLEYYGDPTTSSGCPFCGSYNYDGIKTTRRNNG